MVGSHLDVYLYKKRHMDKFEFLRSEIQLPLNLGHFTRVENIDEDENAKNTF
jgi:hypothetical protein